MKKMIATFNKLTLALAATVVLAGGCISEYENINTKPYSATDKQISADDYIIQGALKTMQGYVVPVQEHQFQFVDVLCGSTLGGYLAEKKGWETKISTYNPADEWASSAFEKLIPGVSIAHTQLKNSTEDPVSLAVADIVSAAVFSQVTDLYGPIPYSKIGADGSLTAPYDSQEDIYNSMFISLTEAINTLSERVGSKINTNADLVLGGDVTKWIKFANTLKLRLALRVVYADPTLAQTMAEEAINSTYGTLADNSDNPSFTHTQQNLYYLLCHQWSDYRAAADIVSYMNGYSDPRRAAYFTESSLSSSVKYVGWRRGTAMAVSTNGDDCSNINVTTSDQMLWMNAAEAAFLKAEAALRGWSTPKTAKAYYEEGVTLSFSQWGVSGAEDYLADNTSIPASYSDLTGSGLDYQSTSGVKIAWDNGTDFETNLERIITQKWIANWRMTGVEAWSEFRRTGYPKLFTSASNQSGGVIASNGFARRLPYPITEKTNNTENYRKALSESLKGADNMATRVWWDCNPNTK